MYRSVAVYDGKDVGDFSWGKQKIALALPLTHIYKISFFYFIESKNTLSSNIFFALIAIK